MESFEHVGEWWLPETPDRKASGILKYNPTTGGTLELLGALVNIQESDQPSRPPIILGKCLEGKVTLLNNSQTRSQLTLEGVGLTIFQTRLICNGIHLKSKNHLEFLSLSIHYSYLNQWVGVSTFNVLHSYKTGDMKSG